MRALLLIAATIVGAANLFSQGVVIFANSGAPDAPIANGVTGELLSGTAYKVQLYGFTANASESNLLPLGTPTSFFSGLLAGYFDGGKVTNSYVAAGEVGTFQVRAWSSPYGSYEQAQLYAIGNSSVLLGQSSLFQTPTGVISAGLLGLQSFTVNPVPEPTPFVLLATAGLLLCCFRRKTTIRWMLIRTLGQAAQAKD